MRTRTTAVCPVLTSVGCSETTGPDLGYEVPFGAMGNGTAKVTGELRGAQVTGPMTLSLVVACDFSDSGGPIELGGSWSWEGLTGVVDGFWDPRMDAASAGSGFTACSVTLSLRPPTGACSLLIDPGIDTIDVLGWFEGANALHGASVAGTYWEGDGPSPECPGPVLVSIDVVETFGRASG